MANVGGLGLMSLGGGCGRRPAALYSVSVGAPAETPEGILDAHSATAAKDEESWTWCMMIGSSWKRVSSRSSATVSWGDRTYGEGRAECASRRHMSEQ